MRFLFFITFLISAIAFSQDDILAKEYFKKGEFEKALSSFQRLHDANPGNISYLLQLVKTHQQLEQYAQSEALILEQLQRINYPSLFVELGYNYQLKNDITNANDNYSKALESLNLNARYVFIVAQSFVEHSLLDQAITAYEKAMTLAPDLNFDMQLAQIYGEQGDIEKMFTAYVQFVKFNPSYLNNIKRVISDFISEDSSNEHNTTLRKILLKKIQEEPDLIWNELLSWLFIQQKDFSKAFMQEKAIFNRQPESLDRIEELASIAVNENEYEIATEIFQYLIDTAQNIDTKLEAHYNLLQLELIKDQEVNYDNIEQKFLTLFDEYGKFSQTLQLQIAYAHFLAFYMDESDRATSFLKETLSLQLSTFQQAQVKIELGDILVLQEKFNEALIYYTQIQRNLKNSTISQDARFRVAKTSYYKGDFRWAESQLKILKSSTSQLIANDALELKLLISDNKFDDSLQVALKLYAKADLLAFQNRNNESIKLLDQILEEHKTETIIPQALLKQAQLFEKKDEYEKAEKNYDAIIKNYRESILIDDAIFSLAELYADKLAQPDKAKELYEQIIFNHADSIYFVDSRKKFRALRGDAIN
ncbi:MAG TPA: tetratricopeptide repeat protein [Flavobacteriaceae bacterium]|nr:tetratricopeptide repeat protein [Flavobacteriaceae bacterium]